MKVRFVTICNFKSLPMPFKQWREQMELYTGRSTTFCKKTLTMRSLIIRQSI